MINANGRDRVVMMQQTFVPESEAAYIIGIPVMRLRRSPELHNVLKATKIAGHPYYSLSECEKVKIRLSGHILRNKMKNKPIDIEERKEMRETIIYGLTCYPKKKQRRKI